MKADIDNMYTTWLCSNKTLFIKTGGQPEGYGLPSPILEVFHHVILLYLLKILFIFQAPSWTWVIYKIYFIFDFPKWLVFLSESPLIMILHYSKSSPWPCHKYIWYLPDKIRTLFSSLQISWHENIFLAGSDCLNIMLVNRQKRYNTLPTLFSDYREPTYSSFSVTLSLINVLSALLNQFSWYLLSIPHLTMNYSVLII